MKKPMFSILIPVYNVEKYLPKCIQSVKNQTYNDYEVIILDDGSIDGSRKLCEQWADEDSRVHFIHRENKGLFTTRLDEIEASNGEYLIFLDSDDYIDEDLLFRVSQLISQYNCDLVTYGRSIVNEVNESHIVHSEVFPDEMVFNGSQREVVLKKLQDKSNSLVSIWAKCPRRDLLVSKVPMLREYEGLNIGEDKLLTTCLFVSFEKMVYTDYPLYYYRCDGSGMSSKSKIKAFPDTIKYVRACECVLESTDFQGKEEVMQKFWNRDAYGRLALLKSYLQQNIDRATYKDCYMEIKSFLVPHMKHVKLKYRVGLYFFIPENYWLLNRFFLRKNNRTEIK